MLLSAARGMVDETDVVSNRSNRDANLAGSKLNLSTPNAMIVEYA